jgi:DinB superfamily
MKSKRRVYKKRRAPKKASNGGHDAALRKHLIELLGGRGAHADFDEAIEGLPEELRGARVKDVPFTPWRLLEHLRMAQWDILVFSRNGKHKSPKWPEGYWPDGDAPPNSAAWDASVAAFRRDLGEMEKLVKDPSNDLFAPIPHGQGQTLLREALLAADHNSYHVGQLILLRRLLGAWK